MLRARKNNVQTDDDLIKKMTEGSLTTTSFRTVERDLGEKNFGRRSLAIASAFLEFSCYMANLFIVMITNMCTNSKGAIEPIMLFFKLRYDETPTKVRVQDPAHDIQHAADSKSSHVDPLMLAVAPSEVSSLHAKILQIECSVGILTRDIQSDKCSYMSIGVPTSLMALEATTGENIEAALMHVINCVPELQKRHSLYKLCIRHSCSDQAASNFKAERLLSAKMPGYATCHTLCHLPWCFISPNIPWIPAFSYVSFAG